MIQLVDQEKVMAPIKGPDGQPHTLQNNKDYVIKLLCETIMSMFANLNPVQVEKFIHEFFNTVEDWMAFKGAVRDLMISMRSFSSQQNDFYEYETKVSIIFNIDLFQIQKEKTAKKDQARKMMVPGMGHLAA